MSNRYDAANQFANRPADESFGTLAGFLAHLRTEKNQSREYTRAIKDLKFNPHADGSVVLTNPLGQSARLTHWSFSQMARLINAPAGYLRSLPADITAAAGNYGISKIARQDVKLLARATKKDDDTPGEPIIRAVTSTGYSRVWSADLYADLVDHLAPQGFDLPPVWKHLDKHGTGKAGAYAGDRDAFLILALGESSIVNDPTARRSQLDTSGGPGGNAQALYPAVIIKNSDVGASAVIIEVIFYRFICGNHIIWNVDTSAGSAWKRRHVGQNAQRDSVREILRIARTLTTQNPEQVERMIKTLAEREIAETRDGVIAELRSIGYSEADAEAAYDATATEQSSTTASPRSYWGIVQGTTYVSQATGYQDQRLDLDQLAAQLLQRGRKLIAA